MKSTLLVRSRFVASIAFALAASAIFVTVGVVSSAPAGADKVVGGCTIVTNPTQTHHTVCVNANLDQANLSHVNLDHANLSYANLSHANLDRASLFRTSLSYANLSHANLSQANPSGADLYRANLRDADLYLANLRDDDLSHANLAGADLYRANLLSVLWYDTACKNGEKTKPSGTLTTCEGVRP